MSVRRIVVVAGLALYALLWAIAASGASGLVAPLAVPPVLALLAWLGVRLDRYLGIAHRAPEFTEPDDEPGA